MDNQKVRLCLSRDILTEVGDVLTRPEILRKFKGLTTEWVQSFVKHLESKAAVITEVPRVIAFARDPNDEPYLNLALAGKAKYLVSWDRDLLDLMEDTEFRRRFPDLAILDPPAFLAEMARLNDPGAELTRPTSEGP